MPRLELIVLDEEHDASFKQDKTPHYHARDVALRRGQMENIPVVLGSATPTLEMLHHCRSGNYTHLELPRRAGGARPPEIRLVDTQRAPATEGISEPLAEAIRRHLAKDGQVLVFLGRVLAAEQCVSVRETAVLLNDVAVQFGKLRNGQESLLEGG